MSVYLQMGIYFMVAIAIALVLTILFMLTALIENNLLSDEMKIPRQWKKADEELKEKIKHQWD